jgi:hypothetical protein
MLLCLAAASYAGAASLSALVRILKQTTQLHYDLQGFAIYSVVILARLWPPQGPFIHTCGLLLLTFAF